MKVEQAVQPGKKGEKVIIGVKVGRKVRGDVELVQAR